MRPPTIDAAAPADFPGIHNVVAYTTGFYSGGAPEGDEGFDSLAALGCVTIISVDGAAPDVERARARGIRYIHLPIGYNGFDERRKIELARATRDAMRDGPVYVHCHHGKHRSAGAAGAVAVSLGWATPQAMVERMKVSGTAANYTGLYQCTASAGVLSQTDLDSVSGVFPEVFRPVGLVKSMVELDEVMELLKKIEKAGWAAPADHPDLVPVAEAGRLADVLRLLDANERVRSKPPEFAELMRENAARAQGLEDLLAGKSAAPAELSARFRLVVASCSDCHAKYRD